MRELTKSELDYAASKSSTVSQCMKLLNIPQNTPNRNRVRIELSKYNILLNKEANFKYTRIIKSCPICSTEFETLLGHKREKHTCSYACSNTHFRSGFNNGMLSKSINNDQTDFPYRTVCFTSHTKSCIICGEHRIVEVHHFDGDHSNNEIDNLIPLCPTHHKICHSRYYDDIKDDINNYRIAFKQNYTLSS